ncbi:MAG TPA: hypothetical protein VM010_02880 [Chitinophagaceae bacterium]|nr:hypothetical protein [Chitinophagaceae bacterium]
MKKFTARAGSTCTKAFLLRTAERAATFSKPHRAKPFLKQAVVYLAGVAQNTSA